MSFFITFEGIEGCGKTTQIQLLKEFLEKRGYQVVTTREPGGTPIGDKIRSILLDSRNSEIDLKTELLLYQAARAQHVKDVLRPSLKQGHIVICDRFTDATLVYQGYAQELSKEFIALLNQFVTDTLIPDLTILIDCPVEIGLKRAHDRMALSLEGPCEGRFEEKSSGFHQAIRSGYLDIADNNSTRFYIADGREDPLTVQRSVQSAVLKKLEEQKD
jgi:dTMP kinase